MRSNGSMAQSPMESHVEKQSNTKEVIKECKTHKGETGAGLNLMSMDEASPDWTAGHVGHFQRNSKYLPMTSTPASRGWPMLLGLEKAVVLNFTLTGASTGQHCQLSGCWRKRRRIRHHLPCRWKALLDASRRQRASLAFMQAGLERAVPIGRPLPLQRLQLVHSTDSGCRGQDEPK